MANMRGLYDQKTTAELKTLRSQKKVRLDRLESEAFTFLRQQEIDALKRQIKRLDVEIEARIAQIRLF